ncbi:MAG: hypothetical protein R3F35_23395 [Myxococcota bacterium]
MAENRSLKERWKDDLEKLEQIRDELRVRAHLLKADARQELEALEGKLHALKREIATSPVTHAAEKTASDVSEASSLLFETVKEGMNRIRKSLRD